jgi:3-oxoacyl-[acyl-carrier protein] reductase
MSDKLFTGKAVLITGGTSGIGTALVQAFAAQGARVHFFGRNRASGEQIEQQVEQTTGSRPKYHCVDLAQAEPLQAAMTELMEAEPDLEVLINNAGVTHDNLLMRMKDSDWHDVFAVNLDPLFYICRALVRPLMKRRRGKIINISSVVGLTGNAGQVNYSASKAGVIGFTKALAQELASRGICVNCIAPGFIETPMTQVLTPQQREAILAKIPAGRMGTPEEIAQAALFLAGDSANYITGQVLVVDGGMVM